MPDLGKICPECRHRLGPAWGIDDESYPFSDWQMEVANNDTRVGYLTWLDHKREGDAHEQLKAHHDKTDPFRLDIGGEG
jgi:hypothetical protein